MKKNIIKLYAYMQNNLGDDLMVKILLERYPNYIFYYDTDYSKSDKFLKYENFINKNYIYQKWGRINHVLNILTFYKKKDFFFTGIFKFLSKKACCSVYIGGSLYMQFLDQDIKERVKEEEKKLEISPLFIIGANFGPYFDKEFKNYFYEYFERCGGVTFRDKVSYKLFEEIPQVSFAPDVVFNIGEEKLSKEEIVIISVIDVTNAGKIFGLDRNKVNYEYTNFIVDVCENSLRQGKIPYLVSFCETEGDENAVEKIKNMISKSNREKVKTVFYKDHIEEIVGLFQKADFVIATRFHAMILAMKLEKPYFAIAYNSKMVNVLQDVHSNAYCKIEDIGQYRTINIFEEYNNRYELSNYTKNAIKQFEQLDCFLKTID